MHSMESRLPGTRLPQPLSRTVSANGFVVPASASTSDDDIPLAELIQSLRRAEMEVSAEDGNLLTSSPMTVQDIAKEVLDNKAAKDPEDDIPDD